MINRAYKDKLAFPAKLLRFIGLPFSLVLATVIIILYLLGSLLTRVVLAVPRVVGKIISGTKIGFQTLSSSSLIALETIGLSTSRLVLSICKTFFAPIAAIAQKLRPVSLPKPRVLGTFLKVFIILVVVATPFASGGFAFWYYVLKDLPSPTSLATIPQPLTTKIYARNGQLLYEFYKNENRTLVPLSEIPLTVRQATIAIEDKDFYNHPGVSVRAIAAAIWRNLTTNTLSGGSTITQQLVKNTLLSPEQTLTRKLKEAVLSLEAELVYSKDQILEMYLNQAPYGGSTYGIAEAAEVYFGKKVEDLNLAESALLAGLPASPTQYYPFGTQPELAKTRQQEVLTRMTQDGYITPEIAGQAASYPLVFKTPNVDILAPHFVMYVKDLLSQKYGSDLVEQGGLQVYTSLDLDTQEMAQSALTQEVDKIQNLHVTNGAALVTDPATGEVLAMVGSRDYFDIKNNGNVNATLALRQPGSSIKPVDYSLALENGYTPATIIPDSPVTFRIPGQPAYSPVNYDGRFHGNVTLRTALGSSYNVPAVKVLATLGVSRMVDQGQKMGITTWNDPSQFGLSLTLGGGEVRMVDMAVAYGTLANYGARIDLHPILQVRDSRGNILENSPCTSVQLPAPTNGQSFLNETPTQNSTCSGTQVVDPRVAFMLSDILSDNAARTPAFGPHSDLVIPNHQVAVKTGTTNNLKDNWTFGYTRDTLVATWVGNFDGSPMSGVASGVTGASPIFNRIMTALLQNKPNTPFTPPSDVVKVEICTLTSTLPCGQCPSKRTEYFLPNTAPTQACTDDQIRQIQEQKTGKNNP